VNLFHFHDVFIDMSIREIDI